LEGNFSGTVVGPVAVISGMLCLPIMTYDNSEAEPRHWYTGDVRLSGFMALQTSATQIYVFRTSASCLQTHGRMGLLQGLSTYTRQHKHRKKIVTREIRRHNARLGATEDGVCLRPRGHSGGQRF
jgi:hypothetical protein